MEQLLPILLLGVTDEGQGIRDATVACLNQIAENPELLQAGSAAHQVSLLKHCPWVHLQTCYKTLHAQGCSLHACASSNIAACPHWSVSTNHTHCQKQQLWHPY